MGCASSPSSSRRQIVSSKPLSSQKKYVLTKPKLTYSHTQIISKIDQMNFQQLFKKKHKVNQSFIQKHFHLECQPKQMQKNEKFSMQIKKQNINEDLKYIAKANVWIRQCRSCQIGLIRISSQGLCHYCNKSNVIRKLHISRVTHCETMQGGHSSNCHRVNCYGECGQYSQGRDYTVQDQPSRQSQYQLPVYKYQQCKLCQGFGYTKIK